MTKQEFAKFAMALKTYYPKETLLPNEQAMELWFMQLQDIPYEIAETALNKWVSLNKWSPSISEIREVASSITKGDLPDWSDGWEEVCKGIRYYGLARADEALEQMSPLARKATERIGFRNLCLSDNVSADRANFRMIFETLAERERMDAQLPDFLKLTMKHMQEHLIEKREDEG